MSNIIKLETNIPATIQPSDKALIVAFQGIKVIECTQEDLEDFLDDELTKIYYHLGYKVPDSKELFTLVNYCVNELQTKFKQITKDEIRIALKNGADKDYGDFYGVNPATFNQWIKGFVAAEKRTEAKKEYAKMLSKLNEKTEPTLEEQFNIAKGNAESALKSIEALGDVGSYGSVVYDFLTGLKLIELSNEEKFELMDEAKDQLHKELIERKKATGDRLQRIDLGRRIDNLVGGYDKNSIIARSKKIALENFLNNVLLEGLDLSELIEGKRDFFLQTKQAA